MNKQDRYKKQDGSDLIDRWIREDPPEEVRIKILAHVEAYLARYGKKDSHLSEALKIQDFINRLTNYERVLCQSASKTE